MTTVSELWGRSGERTQHWWVFVGGYALVVCSLLIVTALGEESGFADTFLLPAALFYAPSFVAAASAFRGGGFPASLAVGLAPGVLFALVVGGLDFLGHTAPGEAPIWALAVGFGFLGIFGAVFGFCVAKGVLRFVEAR